MTAVLSRNRPLIVAVALVAALVAFLLVQYEPRVGVRVLMSGLTLGALFFMIASGLSLIFGLMDVLNFAHGLFFMLGAYTGYTIYANPRTFLNLAPLALAIGGGMALSTWLGRRLILPGLSPGMDRTITTGLSLLGLATLIIGLWGFDLVVLASSDLSAGGKVATEVAQEPIARYAGRLAVLIAGGIVLGLAVGRQQLASQRRNVTNWWAPTLGLVALVAAFLMAIVRSQAEVAMLALPLDALFVLALVIGATTGGLLGAVVELSMIRPLYSRPIFQVLLTLGLVFVGGELVKGVWGPTGFNMAMPTFFNTPGKNGRGCMSPDILAFFGDHCNSISLGGARISSYWFFIIFLALLMFVSVALLLRRTRLGMIIRAGVQDSDMVQALGINVRRVFTLVFALGTGLAALGGVAMGPFQGVYPGMGQEFILFGFIAVVIGGMGSFTGAAIGALLLGLARAIGDQLVTAGITLPGMEQAWTATPSIARASAVLLMALVLIIRPAGLFGKKE